MRTMMRLALLAGMSAATLSWTASAMDPKAFQRETPAFSNEVDKASYSIGMFIGENFKTTGMEINPDTLLQAIRDVTEDAPTRLTLSEAQRTIQSYQQASVKKMAERTAQIAEKNRMAEEAFFAENLRKPGVKTIDVVMPGIRTNQMQYLVLAEGSGESPKNTDIVTVNFRGTLLNGKEFENSSTFGTQPKSPLARLGRGWTEALTRMKTGDKWKVFMPSDLVNSDRSRAGVPPGSMLIYEIELVSFESPKAAMMPSGPPLTSDIVKVPSAEERKKGAQPEIIKAEDVARHIEAARKAAEANKPGTNQP
jgi:FKBP-type peptidyl-prolyl cis-trans isomerase FklB